MNEQRVRQIIKEEIFRANNASRFNGVTAVVDHIHNGIDAPKINADNIVNGTAKNSLIGMNENEVFSIKNVKGISHISFNGFAANNANGSAATARAVVNGNVAFGECLRFTGSGSVILPEGAGNETPFTQGGSSLYISGSDVRVGTSSEHFAYVTNASGVVASAKVVGVSQDSVSIQVEVASNWQIIGSVILT